MGTCVSSLQATTKLTDERGGSPSLSAKVVDLEGRLEEFRRRVTAEEVVSRHPNCYLCSSDSMVINSNAPQLPGDHALQLGQIYFLMPLSKSLTPLSLHDLCNLAIKTTRALNTINSSPFLHESTSGGNYRVNIVTF